VCGNIFKDMPRYELIISSKAGFYMWPGPYGEWGSKKNMIASCDQSLKRMGVDYFDIFYHHRPDPDTPLEETLGALDQIVRQGKALYVGVSNYSGAQFVDASRVVERERMAPITIHQAYYNMLSRSVEWDLQPQTERAGTGIIAFCPLAQGRLTNKYLGGSVPEGSRAAQHGGREWVEAGLTEQDHRTLQELNTLAGERGQTLAQLALVWTLRTPGVTSALIGASSVKQIEENVAALEHTALSDEEVARIDALTHHA
jgi:L-glyceraldehyde 3-phosphate reductase